MELAITADAIEPFAKTCYALEGDGALALVAYECISMLYSATAVANNLAVKRQFKDSLMSLWHMLKLLSNQHMITFLQNLIMMFRLPYLALKLLNTFHPLKSVSSNHLQRTLGPFLNDSEVIDGLKSELANYLLLRMSLIRLI